MSQDLERQLFEQRLATLAMQAERDEARLAAIGAARRVMDLEEPQITSSLSFAKHTLSNLRKEFSEKFPPQEA